MGFTIETIYFLTAAVFILGLKRMSHPTTARSGIVWAGYAMLGATVFPGQSSELLRGAGKSTP